MPFPKFCIYRSGGLPDPAIHTSKDSTQYYDNSVLLPDIANQIQRIKLDSVQNILFADDEMTGYTSNLSARLVIDAGCTIGCPATTTWWMTGTYYNIAWDIPVPELTVQYYPFYRGTGSLIGIMNNSLPEDLYKWMNIAYQQTCSRMKQDLLNQTSLGSKQAISLLLGLPIKDRRTDPQIFDYELHVLIASNVPNIRRCNNCLLAISLEYSSKGLRNIKKALLPLRINDC